METMSPVFAVNALRYWIKAFPFLWLFFATGCAPFVSVRYINPQLVVARNNTSPPQISQCYTKAKANKQDVPAAIAHYLDGLAIAEEKLRTGKADGAIITQYNFGVARIAELVEKAELPVWGKGVPIHAYLLQARPPANSTADPRNYNLISADKLKIGGRAFTERVVVPGVGAPIVAVEKEYLTSRKTLDPKRGYYGLTAVVKFHGRRAELDFIDPLAQEKISLGQKTYPLAADYTAAGALGLVREQPYKLGFIRMLRPGKYQDTTALVRLQPYDPNRIPVVVTHGLQDTQATWTTMLNAMRADPSIRKKYQFWFFSYPSGYPFPLSAEFLRQKLDEAARLHPNHKPMVLIGHSMGGLLSRLMVTDSGMKFWNDNFRCSPDGLLVTTERKKILEDTLIFSSRKDVSRVIFISTPHRGSDFAVNWIGRLGSRLVALPKQLIELGSSTLEFVVPGETALSTRIPNSIDTLSPKGRFIKILDTIPIAKNIPYHSIIGDRGRGNTPNSSDGVVAYWSSHLEGAASEKIVPSNHSAHQNPQAIAEVERILHLHVQ